MNGLPDIKGIDKAAISSAKEAFMIVLETEDSLTQEISRIAAHSEANGTGCPINEVMAVELIPDPCSGLLWESD